MSNSKMITDRKMLARLLVICSLVCVAFSSRGIDRKKHRSSRTHKGNHVAERSPSRSAGRSSRPGREHASRRKGKRSRSQYSDDKPAKKKRRASNPQDHHDSKKYSSGRGKKNRNRYRPTEQEIAIRLVKKQREVARALWEWMTDRDVRATLKAAGEIVDTTSSFRKSLWKWKTKDITDYHKRLLNSYDRYKKKCKARKKTRPRSREKSQPGTTPNPVPTPRSKGHQPKYSDTGTRAPEKGVRWDNAPVVIPPPTQPLGNQTAQHPRSLPPQAPSTVKPKGVQAPSVHPAKHLGLGYVPIEQAVPQVPSPANTFMIELRPGHLHPRSYSYMKNATDGQIVTV